MNRLLLLTLDFPPRQGGVARYLNGLATHFQDRMTVVATPEAGSAMFDETVPYALERVELLYQAVWPRWLKTIRELLVRRRSYEMVLVSHVIPLGTAAWIACMCTGRPYAVIVHGLDLARAVRSSWKRWLTSRVLENARLVVANSEALLAEVRQSFRIAQGVVVYPSVARPVNPQPSRKGMGEGPVCLLTVARLVEHKGHLRVLAALALLRENGLLEGLRYRIVGDGPMAQTIEKVLHSLRLDAYVVLDRHLDDAALAEAYRGADIFVMPTEQGREDREGFGTVYLEAAAYGVPSIASDVPGVREAVLGEEMGLLVPDGDISALAQAIARLAGDPDLRDRLGAAAYRRVAAEFTPDRQFSKLVPFL
ncbi:glycosyltransferase family 4 protein [Candidatus Uhrbacteria bacterium]|nr:glycosyltransferase family 4 protein [Candidatus Uhrbacteria bacterium]